MAKAETADLVVVGAGMVGGWASWFAAHERRGARRRPGEGSGRARERRAVRRASSAPRAGPRPRSRSAGSRSTSTDASTTLLGTDSGFRELGYLILGGHAEATCATGNARVEMQRDAGLDVRWVDAEEACASQPDARRRRTSRRELLRDRRRDRSSAERPRVLARDAAGRRAAPRADAVPRDCGPRPRAVGVGASPASETPGRRHRDRSRAPDGRAHAPRGGERWSVRASSPAARATRWS